jgi:hypothetical protein
MLTPKNVDPQNLLTPKKCCSTKNLDPQKERREKEEEKITVLIVATTFVTQPVFNAAFRSDQLEVPNSPRHARMDIFTPIGTGYGVSASTGTRVDCKH